MLVHVLLQVIPVQNLHGLGEVLVGQLPQPAGAVSLKRNFLGLMTASMPSHLHEMMTEVGAGKEPSLTLRRQWDLSRPAT